MRKLIHLTVVLSAFLVLVGCTNERDIYYERPNWLEPPIYDVLQAEGRFSHYLQCVDRSNYESTLKKSGLYTVFAPNDEAFARFLTSKSKGSVADLSDEEVNRIVSYSIVYNYYPYDRLTDVLSGGWDTLKSIKKKTTYYDVIRRDLYQGDSVWVYDNATFTVGDNNYKYVPLYLSKVFERSRSAAQAAADYSIFYPTPYTGKNVQSASVVLQDMQAENGVIHEIDDVLEPLPSIEKMLDHPDFTAFKALINKTGSTGQPFFVNYQYNKLLTDYYAEAMPDKNIDRVYNKSYIGLPFNLNSERYSASAALAELGGFSLFAPNNVAVQKFYDEKLKEYYPNGIETVSMEVLSYFINAQMSEEMVWPGDYKSSMNSQGEFLNAKGAKGDPFNIANYSLVKAASNGLFYGSNDYVKSRYFETVFTEILLNQDYSLLNTAFAEFFVSTLKEELLQCELNGYTQENYTVLLPSDELLTADGFGWAWLGGSNKYGFTHSQAGSSLGNFDVNGRMQRLVRSHIFKRLKNDEVDCALTDFTVDPAFATAYGGHGYAVNQYGDMIRYKDGKIQMLGNFDENDWVTATPYKTFKNGQVLKIDKLLQYSRRNATNVTEAEKYKSKDLVTYVLGMASALQNFRVTRFKDYLVACLKGDESNELAGLSADMTLTIFMPSDAQIGLAVANKHLPPIDSVKTDVAKRAKATQFILYHIVKGKVFVDDGLPYIVPNREVMREETWPAVLKDVVDDTYLSIRKDENGNLLVSTQSEQTGKKFSEQVRTAKVVRGIKRSNYFASKAVIHEIDNYLYYQKVVQ